MQQLADRVEWFLRERGMDLVAFADLAGLPNAQGFPRGVAVGVALEREVVAPLLDAPTPAYYDAYRELYALLDETVEACAELLRGMGYTAMAQSRANLIVDANNSTPLPNKTVAVRAGMGWIGRCALLVTEPYGSAVRISSLLTDAPLPVAASSDSRNATSDARCVFEDGGTGCDGISTVQDATAPRCGSCTACVENCPGAAVKGPLWSASAGRDAIFDAAACRETASARARQYLPGVEQEISLCGRCIAVCPYTKRYLDAGRGAEIEAFWQRFLRGSSAAAETWQTGATRRSESGGTGCDETSGVETAAPACYDVFAFGSNARMADELLALVLDGRKRATCSAMAAYRAENRRTPRAGDLSIVTDGAGKPACVIRTTATRMLPFNEVDWDLCKREGEDEDLLSWQEGHKRFFNEEGARLGYAFDPEMAVLFEDFEVVWPV